MNEITRIPFLSNSLFLCFFLSSSLFCWVFSGWLLVSCSSFLSLPVIHPFTCSLILIISFWYQSTFLAQILWKNLKNLFKKAWRRLKKAWRRLCPHYKDKIKSFLQWWDHTPTSIWKHYTKNLSLFFKNLLHCLPTKKPSSFKKLLHYLPTKKPLSFKNNFHYPLPIKLLKSTQETNLYYQILLQLSAKHSRNLLSWISLLYHGLCKKLLSP